MKRIFTLGLCFVLFAFLSKVSANSPVNKGNNSRDWTIVAAYSVPGKASGLAYDGTYLYYGIYGANGDHFYQVNPSNGNAVLLFTNPAIGDCFGMTWDGSSLWITDHETSPSIPAKAIELDLTGNILSQFDLPDHYMSGIAYDNGDFWVSTYYPDPGVIYKVDGTGAVLSQFTPPADQTWDICKQDDDLWIADYYANMLYKVDQTGSILESHPCENIKPAGVVYDGQYLWYVDGQLSSPSTLYKVDLGGSGTPAINIPVDNHNYGTVTVNNSSTWNMLVENTGTANLEITNIIIPAGIPVSTTYVTPQTIAPGNSDYIPLTYEPTEFGTLNTIITVESTDPINPQVEVTLTGEAVYSGPYIYVTEPYHDYNLVRIHAYTRWFVEVQNRGDANLEISELILNDIHFIIDEGVNLPVIIETLETVQIGVWFNPEKEMFYYGELNIINNDVTQNPYEITLEGEGEDIEYPIGTALWYYYITTGYDNSPKAIAPIHDITGDEVDDVIICSEDNFVRCFNGNSSGVADVLWEDEIYSGNIYNQNGLAIIEDIDSDGYADVIVGTTGGDRSIIALSGKTGEMIWKHDTHEYGSGGWVYQVNCSYDYNDDGITDVLAATGNDGGNTGPRRVYCLNGLTGESIWECFTGGAVFSTIGIEDFTGDGKPDVLAGATDSYQTQGKVYGINGDNGNIEWTFLTEGTSVWALMQLNDITGKGVKDVAAGDFGGNFYFINPENGSQIHNGSISTVLILRFIKLDDVNNDGHPDILVAHSGTNGIVLSGFDGSTIWFWSLADKSWNVARIGDITGDNINDVIIGTLYSSNYCYFRNGVDGEELESINYSTPVDAINSIPDIVGDGSMEMVAGGRDGKVYCYSGGLDAYVNIDENMISENIFEQLKNYPNPFTNETKILFELSEESYVILSVYNIHGEKICVLIDEIIPAGTHTVTWNGKSQSGQLLQSGIYFYELKTDFGTFRKKMSLVR